MSGNRYRLRAGAHKSVNEGCRLVTHQPTLVFSLLPFASDLPIFRRLPGGDVSARRNF